MDYTPVLRVKRLRLENILLEDSVGIGVSFLFIVNDLLFLLGVL